ncbi:MAG: hypothetical protein HY778_15980 [Betaproteobacteria bacterium]|nr:hypothetical protein [Betaproteobacteria bacterium]
MNDLLVTALVALFSGHVALADPACLSQATESRLAGTARVSFLKQCNLEAAKAACSARAADRHFEGATRTAFLKKCERGN